MADRRAVRSSSRRITPTPQPPLATRKRVTRSASHEIESGAPPTKTFRRANCQASVISDKGTATHAKDLVGDLTAVEEVDSQTDLFQVPQSTPRPPRHERHDIDLSQRSPGAISEMSGTTAITSFSMAEAEMLDTKLITRDLPRLYQIATDFINHLAPDDADMQDDLHHIAEMQKPDSDYVEDYRDFDADLKNRLKNFKTENQQYIRLGAIHLALLGLDKDSAEPVPGLDLVVYLANLSVFAKQMIGSDRDEKQIWDALRELDRHQFPQIFLSDVVNDVSESPIGESSLVDATFSLALALRTQLAVLAIQNGLNENAGVFDADTVITEVFVSNGRPRGWNIPGLGGEQTDLSQEQRREIVRHMGELKAQAEDIESLGQAFPWPAVVLELLEWVRLRHREIQASVEGLGGISKISKAIKSMQPPESDRRRATSVLQSPRKTKAGASRTSPQKVRTSFGRERRRASGKFDPHDTSNDGSILALLAKQKQIGVGPQEASREAPPEPVARAPSTVRQASHPEEAQDVPQRASSEARRRARSTVSQEAPQAAPQGAAQKSPAKASQSAPQKAPIPEAPKIVSEQVHREEDDLPPMLGHDDDLESFDDDLDVESTAGPSKSGPPTSTADLAKLLKAARSVGKENRNQPERHGSFFERQPTARRVEFGDGFEESQPTPGPSRKGKEPQRSSPQKRKRAIVQDDTEDEDEFETADRTKNAQARRRKAPVAKRVRIDTGSPGPSRQPMARTTDGNHGRRQREEEDHSSEDDASRRTHNENLSFKEIKLLARRNAAGQAPNAADQGPAEREGRNNWTAEQEYALERYIGILQDDFSEKARKGWTRVLAYDLDEGDGVLQDRRNTDLKDKATNMAEIYIKSRTPLPPGFGYLIGKHTQRGQRLLAQGYNW